MKSFESGSLAYMDTERAHEKAERILESSRFKEEDFIDPKGPYSKGAVKRDLDHVQKQEEYFKTRETNQSIENKVFADILEAIILEHGELSEWLGPNAFTYKTSKFDDYENSVDAVIEFRADDIKAASYVGLGIDVTFNSDPTDKFERLRKRIDSEILSIVKYFRSEYTNFEGRLTKLPEVIVGADKQTIKELMELWLNKENEKLGRHKIQIMILKQMRDQLATFSMYARSIGKQEAQIIYDDRLELINKILISKEELAREVMLDLDKDNVHHNIIAYLRKWRTQMEEDSRSLEEVA